MISANSSCVYPFSLAGFPEKRPRAGRGRALHDDYFIVHLPSDINFFLLLTDIWKMSNILDGSKITRLSNIL